MLPTQKVKLKKKTFNFFSEKGIKKPSDTNRFSDSRQEKEKFKQQSLCFCFFFSMQWPGNKEKRERWPQDWESEKKWFEIVAVEYGRPSIKNT